MFEDGKENHYFRYPVVFDFDKLSKGSIYVFELFSIYSLSSF
jgi:hypothetical protein